MKVFGKLLRSTLAPVFGVAAMGAMMTGCGNATDPTAVGLDELKFSYGLEIVDKGNGTVTLTWGGANNEDDFAGYNIYGVKENAEIANLEGKTIKLLNDKGDEDPDGKKFLGMMGYNGENWETAGANTNPDGDFSVYPYNTSKNGADTGGDAILPSCMPEKNEGAGVACKPLTAEGVKHIFNGTTSIDMTGLKIGSTYCFTTLAALDGGKKVAQTTSEVRCVVPRAQTDADAVAASGKSYGVDLEALRVACGTDGGAKCGTLDVSTDLRAATTTSFAEDNSKGCNAETSKALCIEYFSSTINFTAGANTGVQDLGYYEGGFDDAFLPAAPKLLEIGEVQNKDGYSVAGQSLPLEDKHVYAVANAVAGSTTSFYYHLIYVTGLDHATGAFKMAVRTSNKADSL
jgi:hypothetical protein